MAEKTDLNKVVDKVLVSEEELQRRIAELGAQLSEDYEGKDVICVCILRGAVHFFSDLVRHMTCMTEMDFMSISVLGYGLDFNNFYRNLPCVGVLKPEYYE